jgi:cell division septum initiation protein DivIVA
MAQASQDLGILEMALIGYQVEKEKIEGKIRELQAQLKGKKAPAKKPGIVRVKRVMSGAARARIAAAQKKRWAEYHKRQAASGKAGD